MDGPAFVLPAMPVVSGGRLNCNGLAAGALGMRTSSWAGGNDDLATKSGGAETFKFKVVVSLRFSL